MTAQAPEIGSFLRNHREAQNIALEAVSRRTRISVTNLRHIENEAWENLPAPVFVRGFLRAFADAIDTDYREVLRRYDRSLPGKAAHARARKRSPSDARFWWRIVLASLCLATVIGATIYIAGRMDRHSDEVPSAKMSDVGQKGSDAGQETPKSGNTPEHPASPPESAAAHQAPAAPPKELVLSVSAVEATRLKVIADARKPEQFDLKAGNEITLRAESHFSLLIDNPAGIRLVFNGRALTLPNKSGQALTIQLP